MAIQYEKLLFTRREVAQRLGVSVRRVNALQQAGDFDAVDAGNGTTLFTAHSVSRYARFGNAGGRPYAPVTAFGALYELSGVSTSWLSSQRRYRIRQYLASATAKSLVRLTRRRAKVKEYWVRDIRLSKVQQAIRISAGTAELAEKFHLAETDFVEGYISSDAEQGVVNGFRLRSDTSLVKVRLHVANSLPKGEGAMPIAVCAADLAESDDERERYAGLEMLTKLLDDYRWTLAKQWGLRRERHGSR